MKLGVSIFFILFSSVLLAQEIDNSIQPKSHPIKLQVYVDAYSDRWMEWEKYLSDGKNRYFPNHSKSFPGATVELSIPSNKNNFNYLLGGAYFGFERDIQYPISAGDVNGDWLNGGGIFSGVEFSPAYKVVGFSLKLKLGYYCISRTIIDYDLSSSHISETDFVEYHQISGGLGSTIEANLNLKLGRVYLIPTGKVIFIGNNEMSVMAPGFSLGLGYQFE
ncbi:MAG: hypothetical protein GXO81_12110 [Chlorobi bacterium]|nr:hypothetical protein [Chlorobiota bacterium]